ncbi:DUF2235 domain-containing protein [Oxalobacteraceae bacterium OTU3CAMAD1]|nr:DUF2235 domain-containing protein [Oxalobacteraceae bacterium OTU3CAMAD1]
MNEIPAVKIAATLVAPTKLVNLVKPRHLIDSSKCECYVDIGFFFDGTNNNGKNDKPKLGHSNIVRLYDSYLANPKKQKFAHYMYGVGTAFPEINESGQSSLGNGFGIGCEARVLYAMLHLLDTIHRIVFDEALFSKIQVRALCSVGIKAAASSAHADALAELGLDSGLLMPDFFGAGIRDTFFKAKIEEMTLKFASAKKPIIKECFLDVFGFSRGAAQARVFCSWLEQLMDGGRFAGIPVRFRFLGIMDTVASGGFWSSVNAGLRNVPGGHSGWADVKYLRIPKIIENCVHMVAMHELRKNFPLDEAGVDGVLPPNTQEFAYPGAHSDVGGGYDPAELGVSVGTDWTISDSLKLAQIPLNHMYDCAVAAGVPLDKRRAVVGKWYDPFAMAPALIKAYNDFLTVSSCTARPMNAWSQRYLNWRWQNRLTYSSLEHVKKSNKSDRVKLEKFNKILIDDAELIEHAASPKTQSGILSFISSAASETTDKVRTSVLDKEAGKVLSLAKASAKVNATEAHFFDNYVHDSLAGFDRASIEMTGYWRYRKGFIGGEMGGIVMNEAKPDDAQAA